MTDARHRPRPGHTAAAAVLVLLACMPLTACTPGAPAPSSSMSGSPSAPWGEAERTVDVATGLELPWSMVRVGDSVLVSERDSGRIVEVTPDREVRAVATVAGVHVGGEGGLLGLAVDPDATHLYAYSTGEDGNRVQRFALSGAPGRVALSGPVDIVTGIPSASNHNGGRIAFGPDGTLYVTTGDAGDRDAAQDVGSLAGKILRVDADGGIPPDNPFRGSPVYSYGHRNPQGIAWAPDGRMFASEFGQDTWDELNEITPGDNYGWPVVEGVGGDRRFVDPVQVWRPAEASPSGLTAVGETLFLANLRGERLRAIPLADPTTSRELLVGELGRLRDVMAGPDGRLWIATSNRARGETRAGDDRIASLAIPAASP